MAEYYKVDGREYKTYIEASRAAMDAYKACPATDDGFAPVEPIWIYLADEKIGYVNNTGINTMPQD